MGVSTNITHLSFTKQNFAVQMAHKATVLPLTFLGSLSPPAISSLIVSLSSQTESTSPLISKVPLSWQSLAWQRTRWFQSQEMLFVFVFLCPWLQVIWGTFTVSNITSYYWKGRKVKLSCIWTLWRGRYFKLWKGGPHGNLYLHCHKDFYSTPCFWVATELISVVSN